MNIRRLSHLIALAEEANFHRAAERVHLSQPAFSRSIQAAETEFGLKLFDRGPAEVRCTPSGAFVVARARRLLRESQQLERDVSLHREKVIGNISFGCGPFPAATVVPLLLCEMRQKYPAVSARVLVNNSRHLLNHVRTEEHDFFVGDTRDVPRDGTYAIQLIGRPTGGFYVRSDHPLLRQRAIRVADMAPFGLASGRLPDEICAYLLQLMGLPSDARLPVALECDDVHLMKHIAQATDIIMLGSDNLLSSEIRDGKMCALPLVDLPPTYAELGVVSLQGRTHSPIAEYAIARLAALAGAPG
ncbi:MAG: LysR family transcriptional regulator [Pseudomonadota bacterium]|nr:LysR family transcriptional regulator [Pseudomonadota bacterium]